MKAQTTLKKDLVQLRKDLTALRDELRVQMHLAGMDLKQEWERLEPQADRALADVSDEAVKAAQDIKHRYLELKKRLETH